MSTELSSEERNVLLRLARQAIGHSVAGQPLPRLDARLLSPALQQEGATFVTLTIDGELRGCIGALEAYQPLAEDVCEHAAAAALQDYRFPPVSPDEVDRLKIEISRLTPPQRLEYTTPEDLLHRLRPGIDGVILRYGHHRATFLPQVWEKIPDPAEFLDHLCAKMGADPSLWRYRKMDALVYQVEEFHE